MKFKEQQVLRLMKVSLLTALFALGFAVPARATDPLFQNNTDTYYVIPETPPPTIDARAVDNENIFSVTFNVYTPYIQLYETMNTMFYTNNGTFIANSPLTTNLDNPSFGCGYQFDLQTTNVISHQMASTFYNAGAVRCNSTNDGNNGVFGIPIVSALGECIVAATNIFNHGDIIVGADGTLNLTGTNLDLTYGTLQLEQPESSAAIVGNGVLTIAQSVPNFFPSTGAISIDRVGEWNPGVDLTPTTATTSLPFFLVLTNTLTYFNQNGNVIHSVFIQDTSNQATNQVFFGNRGLGTGAGNIEWIGTYIDPATGQPVQNHLYLNDDYFSGVQTNEVVINGVPGNFYLNESRSELLNNVIPEVPSFPPGGYQPNGSVADTNDYFTGNFITTSEPTNASGFNPGGSLSNLLSRVSITATRDLNMANTTITGPNYMFLSAPNQFDGSPGATVVAPYSDITLGVTNGSMVVTNVLAAYVPIWTGSLTAWSTDYLYTNPITLNITEYRVMVVQSDLSPVGKAWVQNLSLHATNSLVISDVLNIYKSLFIDAQNLTLTTNVFGNGSTSPDGEINWDNLTTLGPTQMPNLLWLTNNGAIRAGNLAQFGSAALKYGALINNGFMSDHGLTIWATNFFSTYYISNGIGAFALQAQTATLSNALVTAGSDLTIAANSLVLSNASLQTGRQLTLSVTNVLTDLNSTNGFWAADTLGISGIDNGFNLPIKPALGDLLGTTVTNTAPAGKSINNLWAALDRGYSNAGYMNDVGVGQLVLDVQGSSARMNFNGTGVNGVTNAIYVDCLQLHHYASYTNRLGTSIPTLTFTTNVVIYYAQALTDDGISIAEKINHFNGDHLRWVPSHAGIFSGTNITYPDGSSQFVNAALATSPDIDSNGNGIPNASDPAPIFTPSQTAFTISVTNLPPKSLRLQWVTIANATNYIYYTTNLASPWLPLTAFKNFYYDPGQSGTNSLHTNWFPSPLPYPSAPANVWIYDPLANLPHFYRIIVQPQLTYPN